MENRKQTGKRRAKISLPPRRKMKSNTRCPEVVTGCESYTPAPSPGRLLIHNESLLGLKAISVFAPLSLAVFPIRESA